MQRFVMTKGLPRKPGAKKDAVPEWTGPDPAAFLPDSVWQGPIQSRTRVWKQVSDSCSPRSWVEQDVSTVGWEDAADPGQRKFGLDPEAFGAMFLTEGVYLVAGETRRQSVTRPNPATEWMRGSWNLDPADSGRVASGSPDVFPTLNLSEFGRIMEVALAKAAERKDQPINGFAVLIKVED